MTAKISKPAAKRATYRILASGTQMYEFEITAMSPEGACSALWERLRRDIRLEAPEAAKLYGCTWNDPSDKGVAWIIEGGILPADPAGTSYDAWNGSEIVRTRIQA